MNAGRVCPLCLGRRPQPWQVVCAHCWHLMPRGLRGDLQYAWRYRVIDHGHYQEVLAAALDWARERVRPTT